MVLAAPIQARRQRLTVKPTGLCKSQRRTESRAGTTAGILYGQSYLLGFQHPVGQPCLVGQQRLGRPRLLGRLKGLKHSGRSAFATNLPHRFMPPTGALTTAALKCFWNGTCRRELNLRNTPPLDAEVEAALPEAASLLQSEWNISHPHKSSPVSLSACCGNEERLKVAEVSCSGQFRPPG